MRRQNMPKPTYIATCLLGCLIFILASCGRFVVDGQRFGPLPPTVTDPIADTEFEDGLFRIGRQGEDSSTSIWMDQGEFSDRQESPFTKEQSYAFFSDIFEGRPQSIDPIIYEETDFTADTEKLDREGVGGTGTGAEKLDRDRGLGLAADVLTGSGSGGTSAAGEPVSKTEESQPLTVISKSAADDVGPKLPETAMDRTATEPAASISAGSGPAENKNNVKDDDGEVAEKTPVQPSAKLEAQVKVQDAESVARALEESDKNNSNPAQENLELQEKLSSTECSWSHPGNCWGALKEKVEGVRRFFNIGSDSAEAGLKEAEGQAKQETKQEAKPSVRTPQSFDEPIVVTGQAGQRNQRQTGQTPAAQSAPTNPDTRPSVNRHQLRGIPREIYENRYCDAIDAMAKKMKDEESEIKDGKFGEKPTSFPFEYFSRIESVVQKYRLRVDPVELRKNHFICLMLPIAVRVNRIVWHDRLALLGLKEKLKHERELTKTEQRWLAELKETYDVRVEDMDAALKELLVRVDVIPVAMVIAEAAKETRWGLRVPSGANNLFGIGTSGVSKHYFSVSQNASDYLRNLNTDQAYSGLRQRRAMMRAAGMPMNSLLLVKEVKKYVPDSHYFRDARDIVLKGSKIGEAR